MSLHCAVLACRAEIATGDEYYALGNGSVITCVPCATTRRFTLQVSGKPVQFERGWHLTPLKHLSRRHDV